MLKINRDGPTLLWYILTLYHGTARQIICAQRKKIENFNLNVNFYRGDIEIFCNSMQTTIQSLVDTRGTDKQVFDKIYKAISETHLPKFNQEMQVWKSVAESSLNPAKQPSTTTILQKSRKLYQEYGVQKKWHEYVPSTGGNNSQKKPRTEDLTDVAALIAQNKLFKKDLKNIKTGLNTGQALRPNGSARQDGKYSWENHYGNDKEFSTKEEFIT